MMKFFRKNIIGWRNFGDSNIESLSEFFPINRMRKLRNIIPKEPKWGRELGRERMNLQKRSKGVDLIEGVGLLVKAIQVREMET